VTTPNLGGPTVRRILVGAQLRRLREAANITRDDAGYIIRSSGSKISRLELGKVGFKERDIEDLLTHYGVTDPRQREPLLALARDANAPGWWHNYDDVLAPWFETYVGLEEAASLIRTYEVQFIPGLLQTEDYARAVTLAGRPDLPNEEVERKVKLRMHRQRILTRETDTPRLWAVIDEGALRRPIGGSKVMKAQLEHLLSMRELKNVTIQIMPFRFGGHAAEGGAFSILRFPEPELPDVVYVEQLVSALYLDKREQIERYVQIFERLTVDCQPPDLSAEMLMKIVSRA
jgi:transcriptional regulator with XRE-family HTH domain